MEATKQIQFKFAKNSHIVVRYALTEETAETRARVLYYNDDGYVLGFKPTTKGSCFCQPIWKDKKEVEKNYILDQVYYFRNN